MSLTSTQPSTAAQDTSVPPVLYMALELSKKSWRLHANCPGRGESQRAIRPSVAAVAEELARLRLRFELPGDCRVLSCYEASYQGFSVHRSLEELGVESSVLDPKILSRGRVGRMPKTDRLDGEELLITLLRWHRDGEKLTPVKVPPREVEDLRRIQRERERLVHERNSHEARIRAVLETVGISIERPRELTVEDLPELECAPGNDLGRWLRREVEREIERLALVKQQLAELERERAEEIESGRSATTRKARALVHLRGIGANTAMLLAQELGWREYRNSKEVGASVGLAPTPHQSGEQDLERGISKAGNRRVRRQLIEIAWLWLQWQPQSVLSQWYQRRFGGTRRGKKIGIVALARKLLVALWRYWEQGIVPERAVLSH